MREAVVLRIVCAQIDVWVAPVSLKGVQYDMDTASVSSHFGDSLLKRNMSSSSS